MQLLPGPPSFDKYAITPGVDCIDLMGRVEPTRVSVG